MSADVVEDIEKKPRIENLESDSKEDLVIEAAGDRNDGSSCMNYEKGHTTRRNLAVRSKVGKDTYGR